MNNLFERNLLKYGKDIEITDRNVKPFNGLPTEVFSNPVTVKAIISTLEGVSVFDDTNTKRVATHKLCLNFISGITSEKWAKIGSKRLKILTVDNTCEDNDRLILMCTERGLDSKVVNDA